MDSLARTRISSLFPRFLGVLCASLLVGCAQFYGKHARRGIEVAVRSDAAAPLAYQIFVSPASSAKALTPGFNNEQPVLRTSDTPFVFAVGRFVIRYQCGPHYKDINVHFRSTLASKVVTLEC